MTLNMAGRIVNKRGTRSNLYLKKNTHIYMEIDWAGGGGGGRKEGREGAGGAGGAA